VSGIGTKLTRAAALCTPLCGLLTGCLVPQPRGGGTLQQIVEPTTKRPYYLYLPKEYVACEPAERLARRWPLVVTFHGMKPYDTALYQAQEWQQEADRYGYVVVAPVLMTFDFFTGEFPLRRINRALKSDEVATLAILDHVFQTTAADRNNVLSTSWSSGGYMAHYMLNRHPERFTCLAVRQSNFTASILDPTWTSQSLYHPVLVVTTQNDVPICQEESREAIRWYESHGYKNFAWIFLNRLGHERTPDTAADFFARVAGVKPNRPPEVLAGRQAIDGNPVGLALLAGNLGRLQKPPSPAESDEWARVSTSWTPTQRRPVQVPGPAASGSPAQPAADQPPLPETTTALVAEPTPVRGISQPRRQAAAPVGIRVSCSVGFEPLLLAYSADCPSDWLRTAEFRWKLDGQDIGEGVNGQRVIAQPGDYLLELIVRTREGAEHRTAQQIRVLKNLQAKLSISGCEN